MNAALMAARSFEDYKFPLLPTPRARGAVDPVRDAGEVGYGKVPWRLLRDRRKFMGRRYKFSMDSSNKLEGATS
jgi:hypothetical protein